MRTAILSLLMLLGTSLAVTSCGSTSYECCYNKLFYDCQDKSRLDACAAGATAVCTRDEVNDNRCGD